MRATIRGLGFVLLLVAPARAGDWYVDVVRGDDSNAGTSSQAAWKTIQKAVSSVPSTGPDTIHIAAGTYLHGANGESVGWLVRPQLSFVGAGSGATIIDAAGNGQPIFRYRSESFGAGWGYASNESLASLTLRNGRNGVEGYTDWNAMNVRLTDLEVTGMSAAGVSFSCFGSPTSGFAEPTLLRVRSHGNPLGLEFVANGVTQRLQVTDSDFSDNSAHGLLCTSGSGITLNVSRTRFTGNSGSGLSFGGANFGGVDGALRDSLIAGNGAHGVVGEPGGLFFSVDLDLERCTVVDNAGSGVRASTLLQSVVRFHLVSTIVFGNGDDIFDPDTEITAAFSDVGDGDFAGSNGNFSADPLFRNAAGGDYRLSWGSPCAETADPATPLGRKDLAGVARPIDGDLNATEAPDLGAFELATLSRLGTGALGTVLELECVGPRSAPLTLFWTRQLTVFPPAVTAFGEFDLDPTLAKVFLNGVVPTGTNLLYKRKIPSGAYLIGQTFAWQALIDSGAAPSGQAYSNAVELTIVP
jgi:hypothetical protein